MPLSTVEEPLQEYTSMKMHKRSKRGRKANKEDVTSWPPPVDLSHEHHENIIEGEGDLHLEEDEKASPAFNADVNAFFAATPNIQLLTVEEEQDLLHRAVGGDSEAAKKIVYHNLRFIIKRAKTLVKKHQVSKQNGTVDSSLFLEAISEGCLGMYKAIETFDPGKKCKLITFAAWHIDERIRRVILFDVNSAKPAKSLSQVKNAKTNLVPISTIEAFDHQDTKTLPTTEAISLGIQNELLAKALKKLGAVERFIVTNHHGFFDQTYTPSQLADMVGVSVDKIKKIETVALKKLWLFMNADKIDIPE